MPKKAYIDKKLRSDALRMIGHANEIIADYNAQGYSLTLRQLYYQFVSRDLIPNTQKDYKRLGTIINDGRMVGLIDWHAIEDRTRNLQSLPHWNSPEDIISAVAASYREDKWKDQPTRVEVWIEKDALAGVFQTICNRFDVPYFSCRGYTSQSEMWSASQRLRQYERRNQDTVILHFGDHDPSGIDMTRDIKDRLKLFGSDVDVRRLALSMDQIEQYGPPPNPAKLDDPRATDYISIHGDSSWELDALEPTVLAQLVEDNVREIREQAAWARSTERERERRNSLKLVHTNWADVETYVADNFELDAEDEANPDDEEVEDDD